jgi:hypothetical protein
MKIKSNQSQPGNFVQGIVSGANNQKLAKLLVKAFDRDMRSEAFLGECLTDRQGKYKISYLAEQFNLAEKETADLLMRVFTAGGKHLLFETDLEEVRFNAADNETIDIVIRGEIPAEENDFDSIVREISGLIGKVKINELRDDDEHRDVSFLSKETGIAAEKLEHLVVAHRLSVESKIDAAFFYALLRKNTLLKNDFAQLLHVRLYVDINTETIPLLFEAALTDEKNIQRDISAAVKETIVPARAAREWKKNYESLKRLRRQAEEYYRDEHPQRVFNILSRFVSENKITEIGAIFQENKHDLNALLKRISDASFFPDDERAADAKTSLALMQLIGANDAIISAVKKTHNLKKPGDVKKLARLNKAEWKKILNESAEKIEVVGEKLDKKLIDFHASVLARKMEKEFPGIAFTAQLEREKKSVLKNHDAIRSFLVAHDDFDLQKTNIDLFLKEKKLNGKNDLMRDELKSVQRIFRLVPHYQKTSALLARNIHSAQSIAAVGETRFVREIAPKAGISLKEAREIYAKAERTNAAAMLVVGELQESIRAMDIPALQNNALALKLKAVSEDFPNLKSLFKLTDVCVCEHCRSVYSPAAYLVEILQFLDKRAGIDLTATTPVTTHPVKDVLFTRRPDLGDIDLSCENANTPVPYIDLVCELLEEAVAPDAGIAFTGNLSDGPDPLKGTISDALLSALTTGQPKIPVTANAQIFETETASGAATLPHYLRDKEAVCKIIPNGGNNYTVKQLRQTLASAEELAAAPAYVNPDAYDELKKKHYAFKLPFDLDLTEARAYFSRFDLERAELMKDFQAADLPSDAEIAAEILGLSAAERQMIVTPELNQQPFWNTTASDAADELKNVETFLNKAGLAYAEFELLLALKFINPANNLFIKNLSISSCDTAQKEIENLDAAALDRIHRFLRWQKKTGWKFETLDEIICQPRLGAQKLDDGDDNTDGVTNGDECLIKAADLKTLAAKTGFKLEELLGFYGEIPHKELIETAPKPLYHQIFLNKAKNGFIDEKLLPARVDGSQKLDTVQTSLSVCLRLSETDFVKLLGLVPNHDLDLDFANLSFLLAASSLMRKLKLKVDDFIILKELTEIDIQSSPAETLKFVEAAFAVRQLPLKLADIKFMLRHEAANLADREIKDEKIELTLKKLQKDFQIAFAGNLSPFDDKLTAEAQKEALQNLVSKLSNVNESDAKIFSGLIDGNWIFKWLDKTGAKQNATNAADAINFLNDRLDKLFVTTQIQIALNALAAALPLATTANTNEEAALTAIDAAQTAVLNAANPAALAAAEAQLTAMQAAEVLTLATLQAANEDVENKRKALVKALLDPLANYFFKDAKKRILVQTLAATFKANEELAETVVEYTNLRQPAPSTGIFDLIGDLLQTDAFIDKTNPSVLPAVTEADFPAQFNAVRLLHKLFPLINSFKLTTENVAWHLQNNTLLGWFAFDAIPYQTGTSQSAVAYSEYVDFAEMVAKAKRLTPISNPADAENPLTFYKLAEMLLPVAGTARADWLVASSLLTGYEKTDLEAVDAYFFPAFDMNVYRNAKTWKTIERCLENLRKLGATVAQVTDFIKPVLTNTETALLQSALKARYDEEVWLDTLKQITDTIRPQKRDALVAYLLATNPELKDENDLFDYFLVDVEMEACMPSSRIVQAHGSVQLFALRCLMGLEPQSGADLEHDAKWAQWKWMKNYRVWEANRKVFLYPENWIEAELRDDKSFLFKELENELQQNELTAFTAEDALIKYLEKLDDIAFLEVVATWYQSDITTMHVFARTKGGDPAIYYYRRFEQERYWTPWEKVELDITGDHLLAFVRNNRLCLAWLVFTEETDPSPHAKVPVVKLQNTNVVPAADPVDLDKPKRKLVIQLAVSEFANKKWQPKKVSKEGIHTPSDYVDDELPRDKYNIFYLEASKQIYLLGSGYKGLQYRQSSVIYNRGQEYHQLCGIFNLTGCKGYPELFYQGNKDFPDFLPDFNHAVLSTERYKDLTRNLVDDLSIRNGFYRELNLLGKTPNDFKVTYPLQMTLIDWVVFFIFQIMMKSNGKGTGRNALKLPFGTVLPYFMEDSFHAYVIIPKFYSEETDPISQEPVEVKRTGADALKLVEENFALFSKYLAIYNADPAHDIKALVEKLAADPDYLKIADEVNFYLNSSYGEQFKNMYHPLVCPLRTTLYKKGISELMKRETQMQLSPFDFNSHYEPTSNVPLPHPIEDIDFSSDGSYSSYNWELFFHVPFLIATRLTKNQRFEEALEWFHYMFNPTGALPGDAPQKYWVTKPFFLMQDADYESQRIDTLLYKIAAPPPAEIAELEFAIDQWREKPFQPHVVARFRPVAYQKALLMKYIENLTEWGDYLFRQDTMESIAQATQLYILADKLLGPKPRTVPPAVKPPFETYNQIEGKLDAFGNALIDLENILPDLSALPHDGAELPPAPVTLSMLYFCIPQNDYMLAYWDRIAERLFNIRHCRSIDGVERSLALFAPPIDPGMLVRAAAAGLDMSAILTGLNAPTPYYRFSVLSQKATELTQEVRNLGSSLLQALEKKDAEAMSLLRNELEMKVLNSVRDMKLLQIKEAKEQIEILKRTQAMTEERHKYYRDIEYMNALEITALTLNTASIIGFTIGSIMEMTAGATALVPDITVGGSGFGGSPVATARVTGGEQLSSSVSSFAKAILLGSQIMDKTASGIATLANYQRRNDDWKLQERLAKKELDQIEKQIAAAEIRQDIAEADLKNHDLQIENAKQTDDFMRSKFTNKELYDWTVGQISAVYFKAYQLAYDLAKKAERGYRFELGNDDNFIGYGYWDSMKKGLQCADHLFHDIKRMETSYLDKNKREYELTKHISLQMLDPLALIRLRATGVCDFKIPEALYDLDHPGHYLRRIKSVSISLPCIAGPYTSVSAKLSLISNQYRKTNIGDDYEETAERFTYNVGAIQSIATSSSQNDSGLFELNFRDERYLPFEGCGAIGGWRLELPTPLRQFDYDTISDVVLHVKFTAREGGSNLRRLAEGTLIDKLNEIKQQLKEEGLHVALNMKRDLPNEWNLLKTNGAVNLIISKSRLPYFVQSIEGAEIDDVQFIARIKDNPASYSVNVDAKPINLSRIDGWNLCRGKSLDILLETAFNLSINQSQPNTLEPLQDLMILVKIYVPPEV